MMNTLIKMRAARWLTCLGLLAAPTYGAVLSATINSSTAEAGGFPASKTIDSSGLTTLGDVSTWTHNSTADDMYIATTDTPFIIFDLGFVVGSLNEVYFWNYSHDSTLDRSILNFTLTASATLSDLAASGNGFNQQSGTLNAGISGAEPVQAFSYSTAAGVRYIRLDVDTNNGGANAGLSEIRFGINVPEPSILSSILIGLGCIRLWRGKRKDSDLGSYTRPLN